jgi:hypothetical protein
MDLQKCQNQFVILRRVLFIGIALSEILACHTAPAPAFGVAASAWSLP